MQEQSYDKNEWQTPRYIVDLVHQVLGSIDLDPASCAEANVNVCAEFYHSKMDDGLNQTWNGRVYLNPPFSDGHIKPWVQKFCAEWDAENVEEAILVVNNATDTKWFRELFKRADGVCFPPRIQFVHPSRTSNSNRFGQAILYFGTHGVKFDEVFGGLGATLRRRAGK